MDMLSLLVVAAVLSATVALAMGVVSMATDGKVGSLDSARWMVGRVGFQAAAFALILLALLL
jgi:hypothetical protein